MRDSSSPVHLKSSTSTNSEYDLAPETRTASPAPPLPGSPSTAPRPTVAPSAPRHGGQPRSTSRGNRLTPKGARAASKSGGIQVTVGPTASWAAVDQSNATLPADSVNGVHGAEGKPHHGILTSFLSRKKGRERSPKPLENGVLGKEGARVVINSGGR
jgi:serine/threonine kinase 32